MALAKKKILVVEDDPNIAGRVVSGLSKEGFEVELATDGAQGEDKALAGNFDLVVLDLMLPAKTGFELLTSWRDRISTPVIVLTANDDLSSRLRSFDLGAVDWMPKPFWMEELLIRVNTRLRIKKETPNERVCWADVEVDVDGRQVEVGGRVVEFTAHEFNLLAALLARQGRALSRRQLAELALPMDRERTNRVVDSHIARIRKKLGSGSGAIHTVWGIGYRFEPEEGD